MNGQIANKKLHPVECEVIQQGNCVASGELPTVLDTQAIKSISYLGLGNWELVRTKL